MLTSMFYFNYYKPYLIKEDDTTVPVYAKSKPAVHNKNFSNNKAVLLNKAYRGDIIEYAGNLSKKIVAFKDMSRFVAQDMEDFEKNAKSGNSEDARYLLSRDMSKFVKSYNSTMSFALSQEHSARLQDFAVEQDSLIRQNRNTFKAMGISIDEDGSLSYNEAKINNMSVFKLSASIGGASFAFDEIYKNTRELLTYPLSNHMNFKGLGYYYNYKLGTVQDDTFKIIKSGLLVDIAI